MVVLSQFSVRITLIYLEAANVFLPVFITPVFLTLVSSYNCHKIYTSSFTHPTGSSWDVDRGGSGVTEETQPRLSLHSSLNHDDVSPRTPKSVTGSVYRISVGLRAWFLGGSLSVHLPIVRSFYHYTARPVGHARKSISTVLRVNRKPLTVFSPSFISSLCPLHLHTLACTGICFSSLSFPGSRRT